MAATTDPTSLRPSAAGARRLREVIVVMRHGKRRDAPDDAPVEHNPPLLPGADGDSAVAGCVVSELGPCIRDAIGSAVAGDPSDSPRHIGVDLRVICSPFRRTVQTAKLLAPELTRYLRLTFARAERRTQMRFTMHSSGGVDGVDNQLCEVFGPTRVKCISSNPHQHAPPAVVGLNELNLELDVERTRVGKVPERDARRGRPGWGESLEEAFYRFKGATVGKFAPVASRDDESEADAANGNLRVVVTVMVTHGDAVAAASDSVGQDQIYACEELGFVTLIRDDHGRVQRAEPLCRGVQILPPEAEDGAHRSAILQELPDSPAAMALAMDEASVRRAAAAGEGATNDPSAEAASHRGARGSAGGADSQRHPTVGPGAAPDVEDIAVVAMGESQRASASSVRTSQGSSGSEGHSASNVDESIQFHESPARRGDGDAEASQCQPGGSAPSGPAGTRAARSDASNSPEAPPSPAPPVDARVDAEVRAAVPTVSDPASALTATSARPSAATRQSDGFHSCCSDVDAEHADDGDCAACAAPGEQGSAAHVKPTQRAEAESEFRRSPSADTEARAEPPSQRSPASAADQNQTAATNRRSSEGGPSTADGAEDPKEHLAAEAEEPPRASSSAARAADATPSSTDSVREPIASRAVQAAHSETTAAQNAADLSSDERPPSPPAALAEVPSEQGSPDSAQARPSAVARRSEPFASEPRHDTDDGAADSRRSDGPVTEPYASADSPNRDHVEGGPATAPTSARRSADVRAARTRSQLRQPSDAGGQPSPDGADTGSQQGGAGDAEDPTQPRQRRGQLWREADRTALYSRLHATMTTSRRSQLSRASSLATARSQSVGTDQGRRQRSPAGAPELRTASRRSPAAARGDRRGDPPAGAAAAGESPRPGSRPATPRPGTPRTGAAGGAPSSNRGQTPPRSRTPTADSRPPAAGAPTATARGRSPSPQSHRPAWCGASRVSTPRDPAAAAPSPGPRKHSKSPQRGEAVFSDLYEAARKRRERLAAAAEKRREEEAEAVLRATKPRAAAGVSMYNAPSANDQNAAMRKLIAALHADPNSAEATPALPKYRRRIPADELERQIHRLAISHHHKQHAGSASDGTAAAKPAHQTREEAELAKCTFRPHISEKSKELIGSARRQRTPSPQRLYRTRSELDRKNATEADGRLRREASQLFREHVAANPTFKRRLDFEGDPAAAKEDYIARSVRRMQEERRIHDSERALSIHKGVVIGPRCADRDELVGNMKTVGLSGVAMTALPASAADRRRRPTSSSKSPSGQRSRSTSAQQPQPTAAARNRYVQRKPSPARGASQPHEPPSRSKGRSASRQETPPGEREGRPSFERTA